MDQLAANKAIVQRYFDAFVDGDLDALNEVLAPDVVDHTADEGQAVSRRPGNRWRWKLSPSSVCGMGW